MQATAWSFWRRRNAAALSHHGVRMIYDPEMRRAAALVLGITFTILGVAGAFILSWFKPAGQVGDSTIIADRTSGQVYVMVAGRLHPALNLASARLIAGGQGGNPAFVTAAEIGKYPAGPTVGIPGAPSSMPIRTPDTSTWTLCDTRPTPTPTMSAAANPTVTLIGGDLTTERAAPLTGRAAILATYGGETWLITGGHRAEIDPSDKAAWLVLGLDAAGAPLPLSQAVFDALPAGPLPNTRSRHPGRLTPVDTSTNGTTCVSWRKGSTDRAATLTVLSGQGLPIPVGADNRIVHIVKDATSPVEADQAYINPTAVNTVTVTGAAADATSRETLWWISDQGVRYGLELDDQSLKALGVATASVRQAPWVLIRTAAPGPELSRADALIIHDSLTAAEPLPTPH